MPVGHIRAVLFDMGGTLEDLYYDDCIRHGATRGLLGLLRRNGVDPGLSLPDLEATVQSGIEAYQAWREKSEVELPPERIWAEFVFGQSGLPQERLVEVAEEIAFYYETHYYRRSLRPEARPALEALREAGFRLAVISNVMSRTLVPAKLAEYGVSGWLDPVVTSAEFGWRKPNARIFAEAARRMQLPPSTCAYVGDTLSRDVLGARRAGYGLAIQKRSFLTEKADGALWASGPEASLLPDALIEDLRQVLPLVGSCGEVCDGH